MGKSEAFRQLLKSYYEARVARLERYPVRAFAQELGIDASSLHDILKGERKLGSKLIMRLGKKIGLRDDELEDLINEDR